MGIRGKAIIRYESVPEETRSEIYNLWLTQENNSYHALGKMYDLPHTMIGKIIEVKFSANRKRRQDAD